MSVGENAPPKNQFLKVLKMDNVIAEITAQPGRPCCKTGDHPNSRIAKKHFLFLTEIGPTDPIPMYFRGIS